MSIIGIAACTKLGVIGVNNAIPWHYKEDFAFFRFMTTGHTVVMGGNTFRSIGKPLPNRKNVVFTRKGGENSDNIEFIDLNDRSCMKAIEPYLFDEDDVYIIGGGEIYKMFFDFIDKWIITIVEDNIDPNGSTTIDISRIENIYKKSSEIKLSDKCKVIKFYDKMSK